MSATSSLTPFSHGPTTPEWEAAHLALKRNDELWRSLAFQGFQPDARGRLHEVRCCPVCQSTLLRRISRPRYAHAGAHTGIHHGSTTQSGSKARIRRAAAAQLRGSSGLSTYSAGDASG